MIRNTTSNLGEKFVRSQSSATYGMPMNFEDFAQHHFTYLVVIPSLIEESIEIREQKIDELKERRIIASLKMDERRKRLGPIDIKVADLIKEAREKRVKDILGEDK